VFPDSDRLLAHLSHSASRDRLGKVQTISERMVVLLRAYRPLTGTLKAMRSIQTPGKWR
jgi:hypothetical protein